MSSSDVFAVISDPTRRQILSLLREGDLAVGELVDELGASQPTVSKHVKLLRETGLVTMRADGQRRFYSLNKAPLDEVSAWLANFGVRPASVAKPLRDVPAATPAATIAEAEPDLSGLDANDPSVQQQFQRTVERAAERAADLFSHLPKLRRRREDP